VRTYTWKNVRIDGGGFVPGIVFNRKRENLIYARTDIGGAYRWNQSRQSWTPLLDWVGWTTGATTAWSASPPTRSTRTGSTPRPACTPTAGTRTTARSCAPPTGRHLAGHHAAVQARRQHARPRHGRAARGRPEPTTACCTSARRGRQRPVAQHRLRRHLGEGDRFPNAGNYVQDPSDTNGYLKPQPGRDLGDLRQVDRHGRQRHADDLRRRGGQGEHGLPQPPTAAPPGRGSPASRPATSRTRACWTGSTATCTSPPATPAARTTAQGRGLEATPRDRRVDQISPIPSADDYFGYSGLTVDRCTRHAHGRHPDLLVAGRDLLPQHRRGATWTRIWDWTSYPNRPSATPMDISAEPRG
jgi:xyloglucan-specific exo-beta-1,4-glucanase